MDLRIDSKLEQLNFLNELATKCTATISAMPRSPKQTMSAMADTVAKIVDLQKEIDRDIQHLIDIKRQIGASIKAVDNQECQTLLELRFLCAYTWEEIAIKMGFSIQHTYRMRDRALKKIVVSAGGE